MSEFDLSIGRCLRLNQRVLQHRIMGAYMTTRRDIPGIEAYDAPAGGWGALRATAKAVREQMGVVDAPLTLTLRLPVLSMIRPNRIGVPTAAIAPNAIPPALARSDI
jgi:hypothetical protein